MSETDWQLHADWQLGRVSDAAYADALVTGGVPEDDPLVVTLRKRPTITCPRCGMTSAHPEDVRQGYCGNCHDWTRDD